MALWSFSQFPATASWSMHILISLGELHITHTSSAYGATGDRRVWPPTLCSSISPWWWWSAVLHVDISVGPMIIHHVSFMVVMCSRWTPVLMITSVPWWSIWCVSVSMVICDDPYGVCLFPWWSVMIHNVCFHGGLWWSIWCVCFHGDLWSIGCVFVSMVICVLWCISDVCFDSLSFAHLCRLVTVTGNRDSVCKAFAAIGKKIEQVTRQLATLCRCVGGGGTQAWMCRTVNTHIHVVWSVCLTITPDLLHSCVDTCVQLLYPLTYWYPWLHIQLV